jgi:hypothetical protein
MRAEELSETTETGHSASALSDSYIMAFSGLPYSLVVSAEPTAIVTQSQGSTNAKILKKTAGAACGLHMSFG